jgi:hypothetical protein
MVVDARETEVLKRGRVHELQHLLGGGVGGHLAGPHLVQQLLQIG